MKKYVLPIAVLLICVLVLSACSSAATTTSAPSPTQTTPAASTTRPPESTTSVPTTPTGSVPATTKPSATATPTAPASGPIYGGLVRYVAPTGPGAPFGAPWLANGTSTYVMQFSEQFLLKEQIDGSLKPFLASSYDVVSDPANPSLTFHLVKGIKFHDGTDFNAQAVKWNLEKAMAPGSTTLGSTTSWKSVEALDDSTVRINLKSFTNIAARTLADSVSFMVSPAAFQKNGADWMNTNMVGTGPFIQTNFQRDVSLSLSRNTNYWEQGKPYLDKIQLLFVSDPLTAEALFKAGGADILQIFDDNMGARMESAGYKVEKVFNYGGALIPDSANADSPWSNLKVRMAAEYAIDKEALAKRFGYGTWEPAYQYSGSSSPAFDPSLAPRKYDQAKAKQLLADAGYPTGFKTTIIVGATGVSSDVAVGIQAALQYPQTAAWSGYLTGTWKNALLFGAALGYANPNAGWNLAFSEGTAWYQSLKRPDAWKDTYRTSLTSPQLDPALVKKLEGLLYADATTIPLYTSAKQWAVVPALRDAGLGSRGIWAWWEPQNAWLKP